MEQMTNEEIFQDAQNTQEDRLINGGDDNIDDALVEAPPSPCEVLQAAAVLGNYIDSSNDSVACKLESILSSFRRQLHLEQTHSLIPPVLPIILVVNS